MTDPALTCEQLVEVVTDYVEGRMPGEHRKRFEQHIAVCTGCNTYVAQMRDTIRLTGSLREEDLTPDVRDALLAVFRDWRGRER